MPNWCLNQVNITGSKEDIAALHEFVGDDFDFNKIIPMPECLESMSYGESACGLMVVCDKNTMLCHKASGEHGGKNVTEVVNAKCMGGSKDITSLAQAVIDGFTPCEECINITTKNNKIGQGLDFPIEESIRRLKEYGHDNWYDWKIENWGTKWQTTVNCDFGETFMNANFYTAWNSPETIYVALVEKFPNLDIHWHYNEQGMGFSGNFETGEYFDYSDPCDCGCRDCMNCCPENFDKDGNEIELSEQE